MCLHGQSKSITSKKGKAVLHSDVVFCSDFLFIISNQVVRRAKEDGWCLPRVSCVSGLFSPTILVLSFSALRLRFCYVVINFSLSSFWFYRYLSLRMDGRVRGSGVGYPPWNAFVAQLPPVKGIWSGLLDGMDGRVL